MTRTIKLLSAVSAMAITTVATPALAAGTDAGTDVTNTVTVNYNVGTVAQTPATSNTDTFKVDRKITFTVAESGGAATTVSPGQNGAVTTFTVFNDTNDTLDFNLTAIQNNGGASVFSAGVDDTFDVGAPTIWVDTNGDGVLQTTGFGADTQASTIDDLAEGATRTVFIVAGTVPLSQQNGTVATINLVATARDSAGNALAVNNGADNKNAVDNVFNDAAGSAAGDAARDGVHSAADDYQVAAAAITAKKNSYIISDPVNGTSNPKAIPGAIVEYCIAVQNASGSATATGVTITDPVPGELDTTSNITRNGSIDTGTFAAGNFTCTGGTAGTTANGSTTISETLDDLNGGDVKTVTFRAVVK